MVMADSYVSQDVQLGNIWLDGKSDNMVNWLSNESRDSVL